MDLENKRCETSASLEPSLHFGSGETHRAHAVRGNVRIFAAGRGRRLSRLGEGQLTKSLRIYRFYIFLCSLESVPDVKAGHAGLEKPEIFMLHLFVLVHARKDFELFDF